VSKAAEALRSAALETREAAWKDGIDPDGPLGAWVRSQERSLTAQALMHDEQEARVKTVKETVDGQVEVLKTTLQVAQEHNKRHEILVRQSESDREKLVNHTVDQLTEQVSAKLSGALVLRQRRYDRTHRWGSAALVAGVALIPSLTGLDPFPSLRGALATKQSRAAMPFWIALQGLAMTGHGQRVLV